MHAPEGREFTVSGEYLETRPPSRLSFTCAWIGDGMRGHETVVTVGLIDQGDKSCMHFEQRTLQDSSVRDCHNEGWTSSFKCLDQFVAS